MTIAFPCEQCGHRFEVDGRLAGKKCKCKKCGCVFLIPVPRNLSGASAGPKTANRDAPGASSPGPRTAAPAPAPARPRPALPPRTAPSPPPDPYYDAADPYGIDDDLPPPRRSVPAAYDDDEGLPPLTRIPAPAKSRSKPSAKKNRSSGAGFDFEALPWLIFRYGMAVVFLLALVALVNVKAGVLLAVGAYFIVVFVLYARGAIATIAVPFMESAVCGLMNLFVPFYSLYYLMTRWDAMRTWFCTTLGAVVLLVVGVIVSAVVLPAVNTGGGGPNANAAFSVPRPARPGVAPPFGVPPVPGFVPPEPVFRPTPRLNTPEPGADEVVLNVSGLDGHEASQAFGSRLNATLDAIRPRPHFRAVGSGGRWVYRLSPASDAQAIADRLDWAEVTRVDGRTVDVTAPQFAADEGTPDPPRVAAEPARPAFRVPLPPPLPPRPRRRVGPEAGVDAGFLDQALADLKSPDDGRRKGALNRLARALPDDSRRVEIAEAVEPMLRSPDGWTRGDATKALIVWGGKENTPALVRGLKDPDFWVVGATLDALKATADPAAAGAVAARLPDQAHRGKAVEVLKAMGPGAEPAVIPFLSHSDGFVRAEACHVLKEIGASEAGKLALAEVLRKSNGQGFDGMAAHEALQTLGPPKTAPPRRKSIVPGAGKRR